ncbi:hypothetical protein CI109_102265 [Kwoniella shandongensis]|uniref:Uncharacterized protein n=1 Tax=Kwoniella shandongensis TaxID=1734106 RepID=A0AAJ8LH84_9TREE
MSSLQGKEGAQGRGGWQKSLFIQLILHTSRIYTFPDPYSLHTATHTHIIMSSNEEFHNNESVSTAPQTGSESGSSSSPRRELQSGSSQASELSSTVTSSSEIPKASTDSEIAANTTRDSEISDKHTYPTSDY